MSDVEPKDENTSTEKDNQTSTTASDPPPPPKPQPPPMSNGTTTVALSASPSKYFTMSNINPTVAMLIILIITGFGLAFSSLGKEEKVSDENTLHLELLLWGVFVLLILLNGMTYIFDIDITATLTDLLTETPDVALEIASESKPRPPQKPPQVFHIPNNLYTYENAKAICKAYDGRLATIQDMEKAYGKGADWCSYGWSENQMALFPTQKERWEHLQTIDGHENDCGRPGINGGYIANPDVRFGINCFGKKPDITPEESQQMADSPLYPETAAEKKFDREVNFWSKRINNIMVAPFNNASWNMI